MLPKILWHRNCVTPIRTADSDNNFHSNDSIGSGIINISWILINLFLKQQQHAKYRERQHKPHAKLKRKMRPHTGLNTKMKEKKGNNNKAWSNVTHPVFLNEKPCKQVFFPEILLLLLLLSTQARKPTVRRSCDFTADFGENFNVKQIVSNKSHNRMPNRCRLVRLGLNH